MAYVYVYPADATNYDNFGLCGALWAQSCDHIEEANGGSEITLKHPIDKEGKWRELTVDRVIKCSVPTKYIEPVTEGQESRAYYHWLNDTATGNDVYLYSKKTGGSKLVKVPLYNYRQTIPYGPWNEPERTCLYLQPDDEESGDRAHVFMHLVSFDKKGNPTNKQYTGYINRAGLDVVRQYQVTVPGSPNDGGTMWQTGEQLFRIQAVKKTETGVTVSARHVFYDLLGNRTYFTHNGSSSTYRALLAGIFNHSVSPTGFEVSSSLQDICTKWGWEDVNPVEALLNEESGLIGMYGGELIRDNFNISIEREAGIDSGYTIEYGKNLTGVSYDEDDTATVEAFYPVGQTKNGDRLTLEPGTYTTAGGYSVTVGADRSIHASAVLLNGETAFPDCPTYAVPHIEVLNKGSEIKAAGTSAAQLQEARLKLVGAAIDEFRLNPAMYKPTLSVAVNYIELGDTEEYRDIQALQALHLYDKVTVRHDRIGVDVTAKVCRIQYDCLREMVTAIELDSIQADQGNAKISAGQLSNGCITKMKFAPAVSGEMDQTRETASGAQTAADAAATAAATAQTTADAKNRTYRGITPPANPREGDIWVYSRNDAEISYRYDGMQWVLIQDQTLGETRARATDTQRQADEVETIVSERGTVAADAHSLFLNGGIDGNINHGLWCPRERLLPFGVRTGNGIESVTVRINTEMTSVPAAAHGIGVKVTLTRVGATAESEAYDTSDRILYPLFGYELSEPLKSGDLYWISTTCYLNSNPQASASKSIGFVILAGSTNPTYHDETYYKNWRQVLAGNAARTPQKWSVGNEVGNDLSADTKNCRYCTLYIQNPLGGESFLQNDGDTVELVFYNAFLHNYADFSEDLEGIDTYSDSKAEAYTTNTVKTKLTQDRGFVVSGYTDGTRNEDVIIKNGAFTSSNGVAAGGTYAVTIAASAWSAEKTYRATIADLKADATVIASPEPASMDACSECKIVCSAQGAGYVEFSCSKIPDGSVTINCILLGGLA